MLHERSPKAMHPRFLASDYLLSGLVYCGFCQQKLIGCTAKSGRFHYYVCQRTLKRGRSACPGEYIPRPKLEAAVLDNSSRLCTAIYWSLASMKFLKGRSRMASCLEAYTKDPAATHVWEATLRPYLRTGLECNSPLFCNFYAARFRRFRETTLRTAAQILLPTLVVQSNVPGLHHTPARAGVSTVRQFLLPQPIRTDSYCAPGR